MPMHDTRKLRSLRTTIETLGLPLGPLTETHTVYTTNGNVRTGMVAHDSRYCYRSRGDLEQVTVKPLDGLRSCESCWTRLMNRNAEEWATVVTAIAVAYDQAATWAKRHKADDLNQEAVESLRRSAAATGSRLETTVAQFGTFCATLPEEMRDEYTALHVAALDAVEQVTAALPGLVAQAETAWRTRATRLSPRKVFALAGDVAAARTLAFLGATPEGSPWGVAAHRIALQAMLAWHADAACRMFESLDMLDAPIVDAPSRTDDEIRSEAFGKFERRFEREIGHRPTMFAAGDFPTGPFSVPEGVTNPFEWLTELRADLIGQAWRETRQALTQAYAEVCTLEGDVVVLCTSDARFKHRGSMVMAHGTPLAADSETGRQALVCSAVAGAWLEAEASRSGAHSGAPHSVVLGPAESVDVDVARAALTLWRPGDDDLATGPEVLAVASALVS